METCNMRHQSPAHSFGRGDLAIIIGSFFWAIGAVVISGTPKREYHTLGTPIQRPSRGRTIPLMQISNGKRMKLQ